MFPASKKEKKKPATSNILFFPLSDMAWLSIGCEVSRDPKLRHRGTNSERE